MTVTVYEKNIFLYVNKFLIHDDSNSKRLLCWVYMYLELLLLTNQVWYLYLVHYKDFTFSIRISHGPWPTTCTNKWFL